MIEQQGRVVALEGDTARVRLGGQSGCAACDAGQGCGAGLFGRLLQRAPAEVQVDNTFQARTGDAVSVGMEESRYLALVMGLYGWPLVGGLLGAALAYYVGTLWLPESALLLDAVTAAGGLLVGGAWLRRSHRRLPARFTSLSLAMLEPAVHLDCASTDRNQ